MRLLGTNTGHFVEKDPKFTKYAILSHTWDKAGEQTYKELRKIQKRYGTGPLGVALHAPETTHASRAEAVLSLSDPPEPTLSRSIWNDPELSPKIRWACEVARADGYEYIWIDSCCIDKSSSSELSEAINSMYAWYGGAHVCYAYLADVPTGDNHRGRRSWFRKSRWFKRGWTLQELIAPLHLVFLSQDWTVIGSRHALYDLVQEVTSISEEALLHLSPLDRFSVAERFSWAASRETTRVEDRAYSLLGIFDINMPTLYGEGSRAFRRLQEEIMQRIPDQSLFVWGDIYQGPPLLGTTTAQHERGLQFSCQHQFPGSLLATKVSLFSNHQVRTAASLDIASPIQLEYTTCPYGIRTQFHMIPLSLEGMELSQWYLVILGCKLVPGRLGHRLGRVCYTTSSNFGIDFLFPGYLSSNAGHTSGRASNIFIIPPKTIQQYRSETVLKVVYISHPVHRGPESRSYPSASIFRQPYPGHSIRLLLLGAIRNALRAGGYLVDFRGPDKTCDSAIHVLILSHDADAHIITIEFQHVFKPNGRRLTINARCTVARHAALDSASDIPRVTPITMSWTHGLAWDLNRPRPDHKGPLVLDAGGVSRLTMNLVLDFVYVGVYRLRVDIRREVSQAVSSPLPVELHQAEDGELDGGLRSAESTGDDGRPTEGGAVAEAVALDADGTVRETDSLGLERL
ncbi:hypothetical protein V8D89_000148 [Ganoderma adspersum]